MGKYDENLRDYLKQLRSEGGIVSTQIVISAATGILKHHDKSLLQRINLSKTWAESVLNRMSFVRRKGTKTGRTVPADFPELKNNFLERIHTLIAEHDIPDELVLNWDQTGVPIVPRGQWTMEERGSKQVNIVGLNDKRQITFLLTITKSGLLLPPQVITFYL